MKKSEPKMILNISLESEEIEEKVKIAMDKYVEKLSIKILMKKLQKSLTRELKDLCLLQTGVATERYRAFHLSSS